MLLHRLNEAFPALCTGPESPDESFFVYASRLSGELMRLREHPVRHIAFPFCCPLDFLLLFPRERRHALLAETLCFGDWLYAAAVRLYRHFSALRTVRSAEVFDAERSAWKHNPLFYTGSGALEFVRGIFSGAPLTMTDVGRLLSAETRWEGMTLKNSIARGSTSLVCRVECGEKDGVLKLPLAGAEKRFLHEMHVLQEIHRICRARSGFPAHLRFMRFWSTVAPGAVCGAFRIPQDFWQPCAFFMRKTFCTATSGSPIWGSAGTAHRFSWISAIPAGWTVPNCSGRRPEKRNESKN